MPYTYLVQFTLPSKYFFKMFLALIFLYTLLVTVFIPNVILFTKIIYLIFETLLKERFINYIFNDHFALIKKLADAELEASIYKVAHAISEIHISKHKKEYQRLHEINSKIKFENLILKTAVATLLENWMEGGSEIDSSDKRLIE
ncbi:hypothetical protein Glove_1033g33 [Diversispora epigaea]|uniref:Uncharacterized protein n=1 Tax=Diversispora epigaea TaxID=1348612 RepID=A0A397G121_9GLOM|nr:hypothetical protein Glove_1033g33 [Diversispora epigaea]